MTTSHTSEEWRALFNHVLEDLPKEVASYNVPQPGTVKFAKCFDHTLLKLDATKEQIDQLCDEARAHDFKSVCVRLKWVERAVHKLHGSSVVVACVVGFHEGTYSTSGKVREASQAVADGASELDMVINYGQLKQEQYSAVYKDIVAVRNAAPQPIILKVILETSQLSQMDIIAGCKIAQAAKADFVKTSTGFNGKGATVENVQLMKSVVGDYMKVKASGGIKTVKDCVRMLEAGAERIGVSSGVDVMREATACNTDNGNSEPLVNTSSEY